MKADVRAFKIVAPIINAQLLPPFLHHRSPLGLKVGPVLLADGLELR